MPKARPMSCNNSPAFQRRHRSVLCSAEACPVFVGSSTPPFKNDSYQMASHRPVETARFFGNSGARFRFALPITRQRAVVSHKPRFRYLHAFQNLGCASNSAERSTPYNSQSYDQDYWGYNDLLRVEPAPKVGKNLIKRFAHTCARANGGAPATPPPALRKACPVDSISCYRVARGKGTHGNRSEIARKPIPCLRKSV